MMTDALLMTFLQEWLVQIVTAFSVFYLISQSKKRKRTEQLTMIKVDSMAFALGKTQVGDEFINHYKKEVEERIRDANFKDQ